MPDLNSVPASPHALAATRLQNSGAMPPPPVPPSPSLNILPSNQNTVNHASSSTSLPSPHLPPAAGAAPPAVDSSGAGPGPGPLRHPRPLTAAELHLQLEKEQEAVVNRLTRELSLLRAAHNASVVSNTSSTSAGASGAAEQPHVGDFPAIPSSAGRQHHRTYSNASNRSQTANVGSTTSVVGITAPAPIRPSAPSLSRQNSTASRRSRANSPGPQSLPHSYTHSHMDPSYFQHRGAPPTSIPGATPSSVSELSPGIMPVTSRYEETAFYRSELDSVKRENEALKRRVRELERAVRERRASDASRGRSESVSTSASVSIATGGGGGGTGIAGRREGGRDRVVSSLSVAGSVGVGVPEDEVRVGESAASAGLAGQANAPGTT